MVNIFREENIKVAPIKRLERCRAKLQEFKRNGPPPYASYIVDYLRAAVFCQTVEEMLDSLKTLSNHFQLVRIKRKITTKDKDNKVILVNLVVEDPSIEPRKYKWSDWWKKGEVRMIGEVPFSSFCLLLLLLNNAFFLRYK